MNNVVCLIGDSGAGKGVVGEILSTNGYQSFSLSGEVRRCAKCQGLQDPTRQELQLLATQLRKLYGPAHFAKQLLKNPKFLMSTDTIVDGARNIAELAIFKSLEEQGLWKVNICAITADADIRFQRILKRGKPSDPNTREQFDTNDYRENGIGGDVYSQQNELCRSMADIIIENNSSSMEKLQYVVYEKFGLNGFRGKEAFQPGYREREVYLQS